MARLTYLRHGQAIPLNYSRINSHMEAANGDTPKAWLLLIFGESRQYAGNLGYADDPARSYLYDSFVPNHKQLKAGDLALLRDRTRLLGVAEIERVLQRAGTKLQQRCPSCRSTAIKRRRSLVPPYRCGECRQAFAEPLTEAAECVQYEAIFGTSFVACRHQVSAGVLTAACPRYNEQHSILQIELADIWPGVEASLAGTFRSSSVNVRATLEAGEAPETDEFVPPEGDHRDWAVRNIGLRRGQRHFRNELRSRYRDTCVISGCNIVDILEAAHITPYRGPESHHVSNGLLLRSDLHTLFDLYLIGIHPVTLELSLHQSLDGSEYEQFRGRRIGLDGTERPGSRALAAHWLGHMRKRGEALDRFPAC